MQLNIFEDRNWASLLASDREGCSVLAGRGVEMSSLCPGRRERREGSERCLDFEKFLPVDQERKFLSD